ncbi:family 43 glycosylhydrolase [Metabacillus malikii]|uniref:LPXTG-motif cell wall-anchored protein n=1 Tax=Metabacillus malikii TaxID=1504265 RepID=A0ABT9ZH37_9BACI|nr:family 43 glycosylhydrolase [Metabacillus malikii]MDQ0231199.1 LPXTG-motif cell wall-anchored protein [Metabacillus malikii]
MKKLLLIVILFVSAYLSFSAISHADNPVIKDNFSADPAALVHDGKAYLYVGHDEASPNGNFFVLKKWSIYSSSDMENWELEGSLPRTAFEWAKNDSAWASQAIERDGKFYWYVTVLNGDSDDPGYSIGVAVSDHPVNGFKDAIGKPLITNKMTKSPESMGAEAWDDIDPTVFIDDDGQAYLYWGNTHLYYAKLKDNMIEIDGEIHQVTIDNMPGTFTEAPWLHKAHGNYYLSFAMNYPEELGYAISDSPTGPWEYKGKLMDALASDSNDKAASNTSHQAFLQFNDEWYFIYHTSALPTGGQYRRSVAIEKFQYNEDGTIDKIIPSASGVTSHSYAIQSFDDKKRYIRHLAGDVRMDPVGSEVLDSKWHLVKGLANDGEEYISFQAEHKPGFYLKRENDEIVLAKHDGTTEFMEEATFKAVPGLGDKEWTSYQSYTDETLYLTVQENYRLGLSTATSEKQRNIATFTVVQADIEGITLNKSSLSLIEGNVTTIQATVKPANVLQNKLVIYSTNPEIVTVSSQNEKEGVSTFTVKGLASGETDIVIETEDGRYTERVKVQVNQKEAVPSELKNVEISTNTKQKQVLVTGELIEGEGKNVTVKVISPNGDLEYIDQALVDDKNHFAFQYTIKSKQNGKYQVSIGATDLSEIYQTSFMYTKKPEQPDNDGKPIKPDDSDKPSNDKGNDEAEKDKDSESQDKDNETNDKHKNDGQQKLPNTATNLFNYMLAGLVMLLVGTFIYISQKRKKV